MAVSGATSNFDIPYFLGTDKPPDVAAVTKAMAERLALLLPQAGVVRASEGLTLTSSYQDVPGAKLEITPVVDSVLDVTAIFSAFATLNSTHASALIFGTVSLDGTDQEQTARFRAAWGSGEPSTEESVPQVYSLALTGGVKHTIKMRAKATGTFVIASIGGSAKETGFTHRLIPAP